MASKFVNFYIKIGVKLGTRISGFPISYHFLTLA